MPFIDDETERLISRRLDGALTDEDESRLAEIIAGDSEAHALLAQYERIDALSGQVLKAALSDEQAVGGQSMGRWGWDRAGAAPRRQGRRGPSALGWWLLPTALAASIAVVAILRSPESPRIVQQRGIAESRPVVRSVGPELGPRDGSPGGVVPVSEWGDRPDRMTRGDVVYIVGPGGSVMVLEQWRVRTDLSGRGRVATPDM